MTDTLVRTLLLLGAVLLAVAAVKLIYVPLSLWFELRRRMPRPGHRHDTADPDTTGPDTKVSVIVPAYNEAVVLAACVDSIMRSSHRELEVIIVNDGSTDDTSALMHTVAARYSGTPGVPGVPSVRGVSGIDQPNAGKGAALNTGIRAATGDVFLFVDADGLFGPDTIDRMLRAFTGPDVGAVCGDDRPANPDRVLTKTLSVISHMGTGLVRRALSVLHCLPIVSGNIGAFRADLVREIGGFDPHTLGEDLELTWRIYEAGYRAVFEPRAIVYAESPSTLRGLWHQRVRWARGLLQTTWRHRRIVGNPTMGVFGGFLVYNTVSMIIAPVLQLMLLAAAVLLIPVVWMLPDAGLLSIVAWLGLVSSVLFALLGIALNRAWIDLRHLWTICLWPVYSLFMAAVMVAALLSQARRAPARWNKLDRTGVVTRDVAAQLARSAP